jgi:hypothetical protein
MTPDDPSDERLLYLVGQMDTELFHSGIELKQRYREVPRAVMIKLGYHSYVIAGHSKPSVLERIEKSYSLIYRKQDLATGGHIGVFMFRDIFARIGVPRGYGMMPSNPFDHVELTDAQKRIMGTEPEEVAKFLDQFGDVADVQYGCSELKKPFSEMELVERYINKSRLHLHAAAAIVTGGYDFRGAVESALLATEFALKSAAAALGLTEDKLKKKYGHDREALIAVVETAWPKFDAGRVWRVVADWPDYASNRYSKDEPKPLKVGRFVMGAQYVAAEVVRQLSDRDFRETLDPHLARTYPA